MAANQKQETEVREVVWLSHRGDDNCGKCGKEIGRGMLVQANERDGLRCGDCAGYGDLSFLPAGDAKLTRLATSLSSRVVVVLKWSRARKRHERQGILIDDAVWEEVVRQAEIEEGKRGKRSAFRVIEMDGEKVLWKR